MSPKSAPTSWNLYLAYYLVGDLRVALLLAPPKPSSGCTAYRWQINRDSYIPTVWHKHFEKTGDAGDVLSLHFVAQVPTEKHAALYNVLVKDLCVASAYNRRGCEEYGPKAWAVDALDALAKASIITVRGLSDATEPDLRKQLLASLVNYGFESCQHTGGRRDAKLLPLLPLWKTLEDESQAPTTERLRSPFGVIRDAVRVRSRTPRSLCRSPDSPAFGRD
ncbi:hypothetical protein K525DRAFT_207058 [Schizophyllum commune Loenen D]|nr:hypothetical protein K525DRAFT_207058 [Schizophyllum commune Loenen D]